MTNVTTRAASRPGPRSPSFNRCRFVSSAGWTHIFIEAGREKERLTRWIFDRSAEAIVRLDVQRNHKWRLGTAAETADVLDSLTNGNPGCLDNPKEWEFDESDQMPEWS